jgi:hypothetical protein
MGSQKPGFFYENISFDPADSVKNPVSLVGVRPRLTLMESMSIAL